MSLTINMQGVSTPYLRHYTGTWFMDEGSMNGEIAQVEQMDLVLHIQNVEKQSAGDVESNPPKKRYVYDFDQSTGIASIDVSGALMKVESSMTESMSSVLLSRTFREMARNSEVKGVMVRMDSPGGTAAGTDELASAMEVLSAAKPTSVYVAGMMASAAYWVGSQARSISASPVSDVGSIGTYCVVKDYSKVADESGVKIHVIKAGEFKGMGEPGTEITQKVLDELQRRVDDKQSVFSAAVVKGRGVTEATVKEWADGRCHVAGRALSMGLIDHVETYDQAYQRLVNSVLGNETSRSNDRIGALMSAATTNDVAKNVTEPVKAVETVVEPVKAVEKMIEAKSTADRINEIKAACPGASSDFILAQVEANSSVVTAQANYIGVLNEKLTAVSTTAQAKSQEAQTLAGEKAALAAQIEAARAGSTNTAVVQTATGAVEQEAATPLAKAKAEWASNHNNCQSEYMSEDVYTRVRRVELGGNIRGKDAK